jgi:hypothetical protein
MGMGTSQSKPHPLCVRPEKTPTTVKIKGAKAPIPRAIVAVKDENRWAPALHVQIVIEEREFGNYKGHQVRDDDGRDSDQQNWINQGCENLLLNSGTDALVSNVIVQNPGKISALLTREYGR